MPGIPGYYDTLNNGPPLGIGSGSNTINFYAYFSAYGNGNYDPNDVNFFEADAEPHGADRAAVLRELPDLPA